MTDHPKSAGPHACCYCAPRACINGVHSEFPCHPADQPPRVLIIDGEPSLRGRIEKAIADQPTVERNEERCERCRHRLATRSLAHTCTAPECECYHGPTVTVSDPDSCISQSSDVTESDARCTCEAAPAMNAACSYARAERKER